VSQAAIAAMSGLIPTMFMSVHSSLPKRFGSMSKRPARFSSSHKMAPIRFWVTVFGLTGKSKRNLINALE